MAIDNRIRLSSTKIDFTNDVGVTGQDHDLFPEAGDPFRFDHMRMFLIGLLANQSTNIGYPSNYRIGTMFYDQNNDGEMKIAGDISGTPTEDFVDLSNHIALYDQDGNKITLTDWFRLIQAQVESFTKKITFSGISSDNNIKIIPIPLSIQSLIVSNMRPIVFINGILVDPRHTRFSSGSPVSIELLDDIELDSADEFTVIIQGFDVFYVENVIA